MAWQFLLQRQDAPRGYCWLQGNQPLLPGMYRLWGRTTHLQGKTTPVEWLWPTVSGRQRCRQQEVAINRQGLALLMPWTWWPAGTWQVRCREEQPNRTWKSWSDGLSLRVTATPEPPQIAALHWQYHCRFPWHQTLQVKGWITGGQELSLCILDPLQPAMVLHIQQPLPAAGSEPVPFCCDVAIPQYLYQRVLLAVVQVLGTQLRQELLLVNPLVTPRLTPKLTVESRSLADLAQQAQAILTQRQFILPPRLVAP
ncbi:hypothetical protein GlitD10_2977 [Gloeomargarita lithophora Alchichica-D10]|uniref:Uncharacterized protein n=1 Tax=Gloeomargarita lithophora Alchichica-D10 TaxID=1188229 RepID=A0A1J0AHA1_9CYAN|nr:hypothetical protein [Gloeomargarita lithophora]APB35322.1 hypothetical protein GlitD10_2977 [Gloeomargarita lithophora Alchichica-D10]